jgi:hypothetical protein
VANVGLVAGAALSLLVFGYFFYSYTLTGQRQFVSAGYAVLYYALPLATAAALLASLRLPPARRLDLLILCCSLGLSIYGMEVALWYWYPAFGPARSVMSSLMDSADKQREAARLKAEFGVEIDTRSGEEVLGALRAAGRDAVSLIAPKTLLGRYDDGRLASITVNGQELIPIAGVSNRLTLVCNEGGQWISYESDRHGFNNPDSVWELPGADILVVGDSFAYGHCVAADRNFVALIRRQYPATVNLGMAGNGPLLALATLRELAPPMQPRVVLWCYFEGNDLEDLQLERRSPLLQQYLSGPFSQSELKHQSDVDRAILAEVPRMRTLQQALRRQRAENNTVAAFLRSRLTLSTLRQTTGLIGGTAVDPQSGDFETTNLDVFSQVLREAHSVVAAWGGQLVFVYLPGWEHYTTAVSRGEQHHDDVLAAVRRLGIRTIDVSAAFDRHADPVSLFPFRQPIHYNETGHRLVAEFVLAAISPGP